jgi:HAD superfamily hydrolase (TIGR01509 family)
MKKSLEIADKVLLFDFDGTLVETEILAREVVREYFHERGFEGADHFSNLIVGRTWKLAVDLMVAESRHLGFELGDPERVLNEFRDRYRARFKSGVSLIPGLLELLPVFRKKARFLGIVTGSERHEVEEILQSHGLMGFFDRIWGFGDYPESKPHPAPYLTAMQEHHFEPSEVIVFEDSKAGMESAYRAGLRWVQICHEAHAGEPDPRSMIALPDWRHLEI